MKIKGVSDVEQMLNECPPMWATAGAGEMTVEDILGAVMPDFSGQAKVRMTYICIAAACMLEGKEPTDLSEETRILIILAAGIGFALGRMAGKLPDPSNN